MSEDTVISLDEYRQNNGIQFLMNQVWPKNRVKGDFRKERAIVADLEPRTVICGFCGVSSPELDGPTGRAWFASHQCPEVVA